MSFVTRSRKLKIESLTPSSHNLDVRRRVLMLLLFGAAAFLHLWLTFTDSSTEDEHVHIYAGAALLQYGTTSINLEHPPLAKLLAAASLRAAAPSDPDRVDRLQPDRVGYVVAKYVYGNRIPIRTILNFARVPFVILTLALGVIVCLFAHRLFGVSAAWIATALTLLSPLVLAVGHLVHTDLPVTLFVTTAWLCGIWSFDSPRPLWSIVTGTLFGFALLTKYSALIFLGAFVLAALFFAQRRVQILLVMAVAVAVGWLGMTLFYRGLDGLPVYLEGIRTFLARGAIAVNYLAGEFSVHGWWYYFPVAFALKTPAAVLLLIAGSIAVRARRFDRTDAMLLLPVVVYLLVSFFSTYNIGARHLLPIYPFLHLFIARAVAAGDQIVRRAGAVLVAIALVEALVSFPHVMGHFNLLAGPRDAAIYILSDSNVDWGQDNGRMRDLLRQRGWLPARTLLMGGALPEDEIGPGFQRIEPRSELQPGIYAVSRALFVELTEFAELPPTDPLRRRLRDQPRFAEPYGLFLLRMSERGKRVARVGNSIDIFRVW